ncbi:MAG: hypothetical protein JWR05_735, partial [Mucilaginibacter sp.]|nr:hypothetical protein [Mucilaginibacter sp.]
VFLSIGLLEHAAKSNITGMYNNFFMLFIYSGFSVFVIEFFRMLYLNLLYLPKHNTSFVYIGYLRFQGMFAPE